jgi:hypothetical protein
MKKNIYIIASLMVISASADLGDALHQAVHGAAHTTEGAVDIATSPLPRAEDRRLVRRQYVNSQGELVEAEEPIIYQDEVMVEERPGFGERLGEGIEETGEGVVEVATSPLALFE